MSAVTTAPDWSSFELVIFEPGGNPIETRQDCLDESRGHADTTERLTSRNLLRNINFPYELTGHLLLEA